MADRRRAVPDGVEPLTGRPAGHRIRDADLFYFDADTSWDAEDAVIRAGAALFGDLPVPVEIRNEARVHLWYADHFGTPAPPFRDCADAIDSFAAVCCCVGVSVARTARPRVYAPHGFDDLFALVVRPNPRLAPRHVYEAKAARWQDTWPELTPCRGPPVNHGPARPARGQREWSASTNRARPARSRAGGGRRRASRMPMFSKA